MRRNFILFTLIICSFIYTFAEDIPTLRGKVVDSKTGQPLPGVVVRILNSTKGTLSDDNGNFQIALPKGSYEIQFSIVGYEQDTKKIELSANQNLVVSLKESFVQMSEILVVAEDPGIGIIRRAIANKKKWMDRLQTYKCTAYSKQVINKEDSIASIAESYSYGYYKKNDGFRERVFQKRQTQNIDLAQNFAMVGGILNFNDDEISLAGYKFTGPTSPDALDDYTFKLLKTYDSRGFRIYEIQIIPVSRYKPLFEGTICISDSIYSITKVDVKPNDVFKIPFVKKFNIGFQQRFDVYDTSYWMPVDISITAGFEIGIPGLNMPAFGFKQRSILYDYEINKPVPDSIFTAKRAIVDSAVKKVDSTYWDKNKVLPLTNSEEGSYKTLDSTKTLDKQFRPSGALMALEKTDDLNSLGLLNYLNFHFNRVEGYFLGGCYDGKLYKGLFSDSYVGYGFSDKKWKYSFGLGYRDKKILNSKLSLNIFDKVGDRPGEGFFTKGMITFASIISKDDYGDYYSAKGYDVNYSFEPVKNIRLNLGYLDEKEKSLGNKAEHGFFSNKKFRPNLPIIEGNMRSIGVGLNFYNLFKYDEDAFIRVEIGEDKPVIALKMETSGKGLNSDFNYSKYSFEISHTFPTFLRSLFLKPYLSFDIRGGVSTGDLPPQRLFDLESGYDGYAPFGTFRTMSVKDYSGDSYLEFHVEHNFRSIPFRFMHLDWVEEKGIEFILFGSFGKTWLKDETKRYLNNDYYKTPENWYSEMGFGFSKILLFLRTDFTWRLTNRKENNFLFSFRIGNIL